MTERDKNIAVVEVAIQTANDDVLQGLYAMAQRSQHWTVRQILALWYRQKTVDSHSDEQLAELCQWLQQPRGIASVVEWDAKQQAFLDTVAPGSRAATASRLAAVRDFEVAIGVESTQMNQEQLQKMLSSAGAYARSTLRNILNAVMLYTRWCRDQGYQTHSFLVSTPKPFAKLNVDLRPGMMQSLIFGPADLFNKIFEDPNISVQLSYTTPIVAILLWSGFSIEEMITIRDDEVDYESLRPTIRGRPINASLMRVVQYYMSIQHVERESGHNGGVRTFYVDQRGFLIRRLITKEGLEGKPITPIMLKNSYNGSPNLGAIGDLVYSGKCYRLYEKERLAPLTKSDFAQEFGDNELRIGDAMIEYEAFKSIMDIKR